MLQTLIKLLLKTSGFFAAFVFACENLKLHDVWDAAEKVIPNYTNPHTFEYFTAHATFAVICLGVIGIGYFIISDIAKTTSETVAYFAKYRKEKDNGQIEMLNEAINSLKNIMEKERFNPNPYPQHITGRLDIKRPEEIPRKP